VVKNKLYVIKVQGQISIYEYDRPYEVRGH
jgi:hypothetical protein